MNPYYDQQIYGVSHTTIMRVVRYAITSPYVRTVHLYMSSLTLCCLRMRPIVFYVIYGNDRSSKPVRLERFTGTD